MYQEYWGLERKPFQDQPDGSALYRHETFQSALLKLRYVLDNDLGIGALIGGPGCGKSYLLRQLKREIDDAYGPVGRLAIPQLSARELLGWVTAEFSGRDATRTSSDSLDRTLRDLYETLRSYHRDGKHAVLLLDDAHVIEDRSVFDAINWLLNMREPSECEFSLILAGEPRLLSRLRGHQALLGKIPIQAVLYPFTAEESGDYIGHRLRIAGASRELFEPDALSQVHELTEGVPLWINHLCELALLVGYADRSDNITAEQVATVADELPILASRRVA